MIKKIIYTTLSKIKEFDIFSIIDNLIFQSIISINLDWCILFFINNRIII
jgi:hypothetical protein